MFSSGRSCWYSKVVLPPAMNDTSSDSINAATVHPFHFSLCGYITGSNLFITSPISNDVEHFFICLLAIWKFSFGKGLFKTGCFFHYFWIYHFWTNILVDLQYFPQLNLAWIPDPQNQQLFMVAHFGNSWATRNFLVHSPVSGVIAMPMEERWLVNEGGGKKPRFRLLMEGCDMGGKLAPRSPQ